MRISSLLTLLLLATAARGAMVHVVPGPGTPLQDAIDVAVAGDRIVLGAGSYYETVVIDKRLKITADGPVTIGPEQGPQQSDCSTQFVLDVAADNVTIKGAQGPNTRLVVQGGNTAAVRIQGRSSVKLRNVDGLTFCPGASALHMDTALNAKIVSGAFTNYSLSLTERAPACRMAHLAGRTGLRGVTCRAALHADGNNAAAALVIDDVPATGGVTVDIRVGVFHTIGGDAAVILNGVNGVRFRDSFLLGSPLILGEPDYYALTLDAASNGNQVLRSTLRGPVLDDGTSNCWLDNVDYDGLPLPDECA